MDENAPLFEDALRDAERSLTSLLGGWCRVLLKPYMDDSLLDDIQDIDQESFRAELQYSLDDIRTRYHLSGFTLFTVECEDVVIAYLFGYHDSVDRSSFYLDTVATHVEGKGIGSILVLLNLLYCYDVGYKRVMLYTEEELDEKGRHMRDFYEDLGFRRVSFDPKTGLEMMNDLSPLTLRELYDRYLRHEDRDPDLRILGTFRMDPP